jgi:hypothetical protein
MRTRLTSMGLRCLRSDLAGLGAGRACFRARKDAVIGDGEGLGTHGVVALTYPYRPERAANRFKIEVGLLGFVDGAAGTFEL